MYGSEWIGMLLFVRCNSWLAQPFCWHMNLTIILINSLRICILPIDFINLFYHSCKQQNAGNEAFRSGKYTDAIEHYTVALSSNVESRPFAAICLCNRGAAYQALGQIADAIADCSLSIALDRNYAKVCLWVRT